jgi:hypothetical protein
MFCQLLENGPIFTHCRMICVFSFEVRYTVYNYADDNTLSYSDSYINNLVKTLEMESLELIKWFSINQMKANPEKFQVITVGKKKLACYIWIQSVIG